MIDIKYFRGRFVRTLIVLATGIALGCWTSHLKVHPSGLPSLLTSAQAAESPDSQKPATNAGASLHLRQSPAAVASGREETDYGLGESYYKKLKPYPPGGAGERTPLDLWRYAGRGDSSWGSPVLPMSWEKWVEMCQEQKPKLMKEVRAYMSGRY